MHSAQIVVGGQAVCWECLRFVVPLCFLEVQRSRCLSAEIIRI